MDSDEVGSIKYYYKLLDRAHDYVAKANSAVIIAIDGTQGSGKTTLATQGVDYINAKDGKGLMDLDDKDCIQYAMGGDQFLRKLPQVSGQGYHVLVYDEGGDYSRKGAVTRFNKTMDRAMDIMRVHKCIIIFVCHYFPKQVPSEMVDKGIVQCLIHCKKRAPEQSFVHAQVFGYLAISFMLNYYLKKIIVPEQIYRGVNFRFTFGDIEAERSKKLALLGTNRKKELWDLTEIRLNGMMTQQELASQLQMSASWIRHTLKDIEAEPEKTLKNKKYYSQSVLEQLKRLA
jgi:hypothetical protein